MSAAPLTLAREVRPAARPRWSTSATRWGSADGDSRRGGGELRVGESIAMVFIVSKQDYQDRTRYDWAAKKNLRSGYFLWSMMAYGSGLLITYVALNLMDGHGQPALLYIVPFTLGTFLTLGKKRGELKNLWTKGEPERMCPHVQLQHSQ
ncbi:hypothetical protein Taro_045869 [Colocasia esculenta]|uniref:Uncharacterized protein n=1 Tax=Colocasia esculenta TaxID=4460 RepID=A0A843X132_COLES|nr:hypothetical protein [Colocasia esculenta]